MAVRLGSQDGDPAGKGERSVAFWTETVASYLQRLLEKDSQERRHRHTPCKVDHDGEADNEHRRTKANLEWKNRQSPDLAGRASGCDSLGAQIEGCTSCPEPIGQGWILFRLWSRPRCLLHEGEDNQRGDSLESHDVPELDRPAG